MRASGWLILAGLMVPATPMWGADGPALGREPREQRVTNGTPAEAGAYPWMVALLDANESDVWEANFCGGVLIHERWVLTAAHCAVGTFPGDLEVWVGSTVLDASSGGRRVAVEEIRIFPGYDDFGIRDDVALLYLAEPVEGETVRFLEASEASLAVPGVIARAIGWGEDENGGFPVELLEVDLPMVSEAVAQTAYEEVSPNEIYAGYPEGGRNICGGDSGGPLLVRNASGEWVVAGLTSYGRADLDCAAPGNYSAFARVSSFADWIWQQVAPHKVAWEAQWGVRADESDADGDGWSNLDEYAFGTDPLVPDAVAPYGAARLEAGAVVFSVQSAAVREVSYDFVTVATPSGEWETWRQGEGSFSTGWWEGSSLEGGFEERWFRLPYTPGTGLLWTPRVQVGRVLSPADEALWGPGYLYSGIASGHREGTDGRYRRFALTWKDDVVPASAVVSVRAGRWALVPSLRLERADGSLVAEGSFRQAGDVQRSLVFNPAANDPVFVRVATTSPTSDFRLAVHLPVSGGNLTVGGNRSGALSTTDERDSNFDGIYYKDDYAVVGTGPVLVVAEMRSTAVDAYLSLFDAETGELRQENDDRSGTTLDASLTFVFAPDLPPYLLRATSAGEAETGAYTVSLTAGPEVRVGTSRTGALSVSDPVDPNYSDGVYYYDDYLVGGLVAGNRYSLRLATPRFDGFLALLDGVKGTMIDTADDFGPGGTEVLSFVARAGQYYIARVTSYDERETGTYTLSLSSP